jgi:hypothetical protein
MSKVPWDIHRWIWRPDTLVAEGLVWNAIFQCNRNGRIRLCWNQYDTEVAETDKGLQLWCSSNTAPGYRCIQGWLTPTLKSQRFCPKTHHGVSNKWFQRWSQCWRSSPNMKIAFLLVTWHHGTRKRSPGIIFNPKTNPEKRVEKKNHAAYSFKKKKMKR